jgi:hypothetical protein
MTAGARTKRLPLVVISSAEAGGTGFELPIYKRLSESRKKCHSKMCFLRTFITLFVCANIARRQQAGEGREWLRTPSMGVVRK